MSLTLHLGVVELPYSDDPSKTTGDVAEILEAKFDVMAGFMELHGQDVADAMADGMVGALDTLLMNAPPPADPYAAGTEQIGELFREFLDREELSQLEDGVPTEAALKGVSTRFKHPYAKGHPRRPSFVLTGLYREAMVAWVEGSA